MLSTFIAAVGIALARKQRLDCSCFGLLYRERVNRSALLRDGVLIILAFAVLFLDDCSLTLAHLLVNADEPSYALALAGLVATGALTSPVAYLNLREVKRRRFLA